MSFHIFSVLKKYYTTWHKKYTKKHVQVFFQTCVGTSTEQELEVARN